ncbi:hypothetical protein BURKHO8Y_240044 [Burkholderia sp. 8Y]|nr:hypothetical protein BURKHO8Y_240044 [Burkholderia sp. 8Y]
MRPKAFPRFSDNPVSSPANDGSLAKASRALVYRAGADVCRPEKTGVNAGNGVPSAASFVLHGKQVAGGAGEGERPRAPAAVICTGRDGAGTRAKAHAG